MIMDYENAGSGLRKGKGERGTKGLLYNDRGEATWAGGTQQHARE